MGTIIPTLQTRTLGQREVKKYPKVIYVVRKVQERMNQTELCAFSITSAMREIDHPGQLGKEMLRLKKGESGEDTPA